MSQKTVDKDNDAIDWSQYDESDFSGAEKVEELIDRANN